MGVQFSGKKRYVTLEWPKMCSDFNCDCVLFVLADHVFGDQDMHGVIRQNCVDYMVRIHDTTLHTL